MERYSVKVGNLVINIAGQHLEISNESEIPCEIIDLKVGYYYRVVMPNGKVVRRRAFDQLLDHKIVKPGATLKSTFDIDIASLKVVAICNNKLIKKEVDVT